MTPPRAILIVRLSALGDVIHVLPALEALRQRWPEAKLGWAVEDRAAGLLRDHPLLDRLHVLPRRAWTADLKRGRGLSLLRGVRGAVAELRRERYDVALDFQSNFRSSLWARLSAAKRRIGQPAPFSKEGSPLFFTERAPAIPFAAHKIERNLNLLRPLGIEPTPTPGRLAAGDPGDLLAQLPPRGERPWVVIHPGVSSFGAIKAWRPERFAQLGAALVAANNEVFFAWGGDAERAQAAALVAQTPGARLAPQTDLHGLAQLLEHADLFVGVDSGPLHLAAMLGTPVLGLYGPKHVSTYGPFWPQAQVVRGETECSPCRHRRCPRPEAQLVELPAGGTAKISPCMDAIEVERAAAVALELLAARAAQNAS